MIKKTLKPKQNRTRQLLPWEINFLRRHGSSLKEIEKIIAGEEGEKPVEYLCGKAEFLDFEVQVSDQEGQIRTLIPRVESEFLAQKGAEIIEQKIVQCLADSCSSKKIKIAEIGTGSGAISFGLLTILTKNHKKYENLPKTAKLALSPDIKKDETNFGLELWASDIEPRVLKIAMENFGNLVVQQKIKNWQLVDLLFQNEPQNQKKINHQSSLSSSSFSSLEKSQNFIQNNFFCLVSDLWENFPPQIKFDLVIANLPYIPLKNRDILPESVINFEPELALFGGEKGLELIEKLLVEADLHLNLDGEIWLEVDDSHQPEQLSSPIQHFWQVQVYPDFANQPRFWRVTRK